MFVACCGHGRFISSSHGLMIWGTAFADLWSHPFGMGSDCCTQSYFE